MARKLIQDVFVGDGKRQEDEPIMPEAPVGGAEIPVTAEQASEQPAPAPAAADAPDREARFASTNKEESFQKLFMKKEHSFEPSRDPFRPASSSGDRLEKISKRSHIFIWILSLVALAAVFFVGSTLFATATITVTPKSEPVTLDGTYTAVPASSTALTATSALTYSVISITETATTSVETSGSAAVSQKATGKAIIYNAGSASQRLVINTRLETPAGLIYRITKAVNVPGAVTANGTTTPGSVEVDIIADAPGSTYNVSLASFDSPLTIPGLAGSNLFSLFSARFSSDVTGGYVGTAKTASSGAIAAGQASLRNSLYGDVVKAATAAASSAGLILPGGYYVDYTDLPDAADASSYVVAESATIHAIVFDKAAFASFIASQKLADYTGAPVDLIWSDTATTTVSGKTGSPWLESSLSVTLAGDATVVWSYDGQALAAAVAGKPKSALQTELDADKGAITEMKAVITPPWDGSFPKDPNRITVTDAVRGTSI